jgi:hypothetical protein
MPNLTRLQADALRQIKRWGGIGALVRAGVSRQVWMARSQITPRDRGIFLDGSERFILDGSILVPPDFEQDVLQFKGMGKTLREYKILLPAAGPNSNGVQVLWDLNVMFSRTVS